MNIDQIYNYLEERRKDKSIRIKTYFYFIIIRIEEFKENFEKIFLLSQETGITFLFFLYVENENKKKVQKNHLNNLMQTIFVYSRQDIINYLFQKFNIINPLNEQDNSYYEEYCNIKISKITFEQNEEEKYQGVCFELAEKFDVNIIKYIYYISYNGDDEYYQKEFYKNMYYIYKEHNALDLFYGQNCIYFGWTIYPELIDNNFSFVKKFLYIYCREEAESQKSFYRIVNNDLRSGESSKIYPYIIILGFINRLIEFELLKNFKGVVYTATKLDENLILQLIPGKKIVNTTFMSASKDFKVAERFMIRNDWRNAYIICKNVKNNIDIDLEQLNPYNDKEVLFCPYNEFIVDKISSEKKYGKKIYLIELTELGNRNYLNSDKMQMMNINKFDLDNHIIQYLNGMELK